MKDQKLLYICNGIDSVFDSQVHSLLKQIASANYFKSIYLVIGIRNQEEENKLKKKQINEKINVIKFKNYPNYPFISILSAYHLNQVLKRIDIDLQRDIFHTRGEILAYQLLKTFSSQEINIVADIRGTSIEEIDIYFRTNKLKKSLKISNYRKALQSLEEVKKISVVSEKLSKYLQNKFNIKSDKISINPSAAGKKFIFDEEIRKKTRYKLGIKDDETVFIFSSGGVANWQNYSVVDKLAAKGIKILNLSKKKLDYPNVINKFVHYNEVPNYLCAADIAIIWRDDNVVNHVASPVKFSEYVSCGLPIITNGNVDQINFFISSFNSGLIINSVDELTNSKLNYLLMLDRKKISNMAADVYSVDKIGKNYINIYSSI